MPHELEVVISSVETGSMSSVETGQNYSVGRGQMSAAETRQIQSEHISFIVYLWHPGVWKTF